MRKQGVIIVSAFLMYANILSVGQVFAQITATPTPTETIVATTPTITISPTRVATTSATPTKVTSLPKTGAIQYSILFFIISAGVIMFSLIF